jgi:hypothetical protein
MEVLGDFAPLFRPGLRKDFRDSYQDFAPEYPSFMNVSTTGTPEMRGTYIIGLNRLRERFDGEPITYDDPKLGNISVGIVKEFAGGFMLTRRTVEEDQYGKANQGAKWLARAARLTYEYRCGAFLDDLFTGTYYKSMQDNTAIISASHTLQGNAGGTYGNRPSTDVQLSVAGVTALLDLWSVLKDENGDPIMYKPDTLIYGTAPGDESTATAIWNTDKEPFTADNTDNIIRRRMGKPKTIQSHFKSNTKSYFLVNSQLNDAHVAVRRAVEFDDTYDFDTDVMKNKCTTVFMIVIFDWRGWSGSSPT